MIGKAGPVSPKLFTYVRYNCELTRDGLDELKLPGRIQPAQVQKLDATDHMNDLQEIGRAVGQQQVAAGHFEGFSL